MDLDRDQDLDLDLLPQNDMYMDLLPQNDPDLQPQNEQLLIVEQLPIDEQTGKSSHFQTLQDQMPTESNGPFDLDRRRSKEKTIEVEHDKLPWRNQTKEFKLACALASVTLEGFNYVIWQSWKLRFDHCQAFESFKFEVFDAMACFVWNLYDEEDFENIICDDIFTEHESIMNLVYLKGDSELDSSLPEVSKYEKVPEQDVCNNLKESSFEPEALLNQNCLALERHISNKREQEFYDIMTRYSMEEIMSYTWRSRDAMLSSDNLDPKGTVKHQLRMELISRKCFCVVDALYMQSWKHINFKKLEPLKSYLVKGLVFGIHRSFKWLVVKRMERLDKCQSLVTYPLSGNIFGSWDSEVLEVIKRADLKRRSEGRRSIGTDHLVFCLHQMLVSENVNKSEFLETHAKHTVKFVTKRIFLPPHKNPQVLRSNDDDEEEKHNDTIYHLYRKAYKIAAKLGHETTGLEHLSVAIISANDDESSWKGSVECLRRVIAKGRCKHKEKGGTHLNFGDIVLEKSDGKREISGTVFDYVDMLKDGSDDPLQVIFDFVKKIKNETNLPLQTAISNVLFKDEVTTQMSKEEMINSLKIEINSFKIEIIRLQLCAKQVPTSMFLAYSCGKVLWRIFESTLRRPSLTM